MSAVAEYLQLIVEPTIEEFRRDPTSVRRAYLACVATFHAIDRFTYPKSSAALRGEWRKKSQAFALVEIVAHDFKHVKSDQHRQRPDHPSIPISIALYGSETFGEAEFGGSHVPALRNIYFLVRDALEFVKGEMTV